MSTELRQQLALLYAHARASGHDVTPEQIKLWFDEAMDAYAYRIARTLSRILKRTTVTMLR